VFKDQAKSQIMSILTPLLSNVFSRKHRINMRTWFARLRNSGGPPEFVINSLADEMRERMSRVDNRTDYTSHKMRCDFEWGKV